MGNMLRCKSCQGGHPEGRNCFSVGFYLTVICHNGLAGEAGMVGVSSRWERFTMSNNAASVALKCCERVSYSGRKFSGTCISQLPPLTMP